jgi:23S rRNA pseudoU1915 N3-methylase RlmH
MLGKGELVEDSKMFDALNAVEKGTHWNDVFIEVIDETLKQIFNDDGTKVIYDFLEKNSNLKLKEVANKPEVFSASLEKLMVSATQVIEQNILKNLYSRLELKFEEKQGYEFADYIMELRGK